METVINLLPISGGLDSTFLLYDLLRKGENVIPFHVSINNDHENKRTQEMASLWMIEQWFNFVFEKKIDLRVTSYDHCGAGFGRDTEIILVSALKHAYQLAVQPDIDRIVLLEGVVWDDLQVPEYKDRINKGIDNLIWSSLIDGMIHRIPFNCITKIERIIQYPLLKDSVWKKDIIHQIPPALLDMIWYCRNGDGHIPCGICLSCTMHKEALNDCN